MKFAVVGLGYVGISSAVLLSATYETVGADIDNLKVEYINNRVSPIQDEEIKKSLECDDLHLSATTNIENAIKDADYAIIATPTNYNPETNSFDTSSVEQAISQILSGNGKVTIIIKSTIPIGFVANMRKKFNYENIIFSPEFLREGRALHDNLYPSRIVVGAKTPEAILFAEILRKCTKDRNCEILLTGAEEAEAIKLFSNSFLAMRVAFFNEIDTFCLENGLNSKELILGVSLDPRIGNHYNNPSFGYGGYCLPKDTKQLLSNFGSIPQTLISAIISSNDVRKDYVVQKIISRKPKIVGIYKLAMKSNSDNYRDSAIIDIMKKLSCEGTKCIIYEPSLKENVFTEAELVSDFEQFCTSADIVIANRMDAELEPISEKLITRDVFQGDF